MFPIQVQSLLAGLFSLLVGLYGTLSMPPGDVAASPEVENSAGPLEIVPASNSVAEVQPEPDEEESAEGTSALSSPGISPESDAPLVKPTEYSREALAYLSEVGFGVEYGSSPPAIRRWSDDIMIQVHGEPTGADLYTLQDVVRELDGLTPGLSLKVATTDGNIDMYFIPESRFNAVEPGYIPRNLGFFRVWWDGDQVIHRGRILITSQGITQQERSHLIREELTQSLGLFQDSWLYEDSIFYQGWTDTVEYSPLDRQVIQLLYSPKLRPGMDQHQVLTALGLD